MLRHALLIAWNLVLLFFCIFMLVIFGMCIRALIEDERIASAHKQNGDTYVPGHWEVKPTQ